MTMHHEENTIALSAIWRWNTKDRESRGGEGKQAFYFNITDTEPYKIPDYVSTIQ